VELERVNAARGAYEARQSEFLAGRGRLDILFEVSRQLLDAETATSASDRERVAALQRFWNRAFLVEQTNYKRWLDGRIAYKETRESEFERLDAEIRLARLRKVAPSPESADKSVPVDRGNSKKFAKAKRAAVLSDAHDREVAKLEAIMAAFPGRLLEFLAGRGTLDIDLETSRRWLEAELALARGPREVISALERHLETIWVIHSVNEIRFKAMRIGRQDYLQSLHSLLQAELELLRFKASAPSGIPWQGARLGGFHLGVWDHEPPAGGFKQLAKSKSAVGSTERDDLLRESFVAARGHFAARADELVNGRGTLDILLESDRDLLAAECALAKSDAEFLAAFAGHFNHAAFCEIVNRARYKANRIAIQDYLQTVYERLDAERQMLGAKPSERRR
jgi:hypothetical protein